MKEQSNQHIGRSSFWERLTTHRLKTFLKKIIDSLMAKLSISILGGKDWLHRLGVSGIWVIDSCYFTLWDGSNENYPGTRTSAGIKWHACFNLVNGKSIWYQLTSASKHDSQCFPPLTKAKGILFIFDLGYWGAALLLEIEEAKGFFLSRIKSNASIIIKEVVQGMSTKKYLGLPLLSIKHSRKKRDIIEVMTEITYKKYGNKEKEKNLLCRAVGFWNPIEKKYHWYLTNLKVSACLIYPLYRFRWQIELIFKSCKQSLNASRLTSNHPHIIESLLLATIAAKLASSVILEVSLPHLSKDQQFAFSHQRIAKIMVNIRRHLIDYLLNDSLLFYENLMNKIELFTNEIFDPNYQHRKTTLACINELLIKS